MEKFDTQLTDSERERLAILSEECAEVIKIICKIQRNGYESNNPFKLEKGTNRNMLATEIGDLQNALNMIIKNNDVNEHIVTDRFKFKQKNIKQYLHFN